MSKETKSPKVENANRHQRRGSHDGDKKVVRNKRRGTGIVRINEGDDLMSQIRQDRVETFTAYIKARSVQMMDILAPLMTSASPTVAEELQFAIVTYVDFFTNYDEKDGGRLAVRHSKAKAKATEHMSAGLRRFATVNFDQAFTATEPR